jgi:hypothetical protein
MRVAAKESSGLQRKPNKQAFDTVLTYVPSPLPLPPQAKLVMRAAAKLAPQEVLSSVAPLQQTCLSLATTGNNAAATAAPGAPLVSSCWKNC